MDFSATILVLKKTKLGETDLIITGLTDEGRQIRAVAKGARKPGSRVGVHLELFSVARVLIHSGKTLGIIIEAQTVTNNEACRKDVVHSAGAAVVVELLERATADADNEPRLFPLACAALVSLGKVSEEGVALIAAAAALKIAAQLGFRPSLGNCVFCTNELATSELTAGKRVAFSYDEGGAICENCVSIVLELACHTLDSQLVQWAETLITGKFVDLELFADKTHESLGRIILCFARDWVGAHLVKRLKSLDFLLNLS